MQKKLQSLISTSHIEVTISTARRDFTDVILLDVDDETLVLMDGDKKVYIPINAILTLTHE